MINENEMDVIKSSDFVLVSTLYCLGFDIIGIDKTNRQRVVFYFRRTSDLEVAIGKFGTGDIRVKPQDFSTAQREIKGKIYTDE
jgi:hypothetical protein